MAESQIELEQPFAVLVAFEWVVCTKFVCSGKPGCNRKLMHVEDWTGPLAVMRIPGCEVIYLTRRQRNWER